jgi:hypothetical protein
MKLHAAKPSEFQIVAYTWTGADEKIAGGDTSGTAQGPYVTPWGMAPDYNECKSWQPGTIHMIDLARSAENWRATRFGWGLVDQGSPPMPLYEWYEVGKLPDDVTTLGQLCKWLRNKDKVAHPESIYSDRQMDDRGVIDNPCNMLFDFWANSAYRYAVVKDGFDWKMAPKEIPVRKNGVQITHVLRAVVRPPAVKAAPGGAASPGTGTQKKTIDELVTSVDRYIADVDKATETVNIIFKAVDEGMRERFRLITLIKALDVMCAELGEGAMDQSLSPGRKICKRIAEEKVADRLHKMIVREPIEITQSMQGLFDPTKFKPVASKNAGKDLQKATNKLRRLLRAHPEYAADLKAYAQENLRAFLAGNTIVAERLDRLTKTMSAGWLALGDAGHPDKDTDPASTQIKKLRNDHAAKVDDIQGDESPTEVVMSWVGKGISLAQTGVGNLAGPPSLSIALHATWASWQYSKIAAQALKEFRETGGKFDPSAWDDLASRLASGIADGDVKTEIVAAVKKKDLEALGKLKSKVGDHVAGNQQATVAWGGTMLIMNVISTAMTMSDMADKPNDRSAPLIALDFCGAVAQATSVVLGSIEVYLKVMGREIPKALTGCANGVGALGAFAGAVQGSIAFIEAAEKQNKMGMVTNYLGAGGSMGIFFVSILALAGVAAPEIAAVALIFLLASGYLSIMDVIMSAKPTTNQVALGIIKMIRDSPFGIYAEKADAGVFLCMKDIQEIAMDENLPFAPNDYFVIQRLRAAGFGDATLQKIVNTTSGPLARTPFGAGGPVLTP